MTAFLIDLLMRKIVNDFKPAGKIKATYQIFLYNQDNDICFDILEIHRQREDTYMIRFLSIDDKQNVLLECSEITSFSNFHTIMITLIQNVKNYYKCVECKDPENTFKEVKLCISCLFEKLSSNIDKKMNCSICKVDTKLSGLASMYCKINIQMRYVRDVL